MAGFMAGFGTTLSQLIEDDRKYYRDAAAKRRDYIQTYGTRAVAEREDKANAALGVANTLMNRGFSKEYVTSIAANNGVRSMVDFADQISKRTDLTEKDIKEIEASAKDFVKDNPDEDLSAVVKRAYGLYKSTKDPVARKRNIFGAMLGLDASMMEDDVLNDMYIDGYTGSDIYRIMGSAGPGAGKPMGVKLPPKAWTYKQNVEYRASMTLEADNYIELELKALGQAIKNTPESVAKQKLQTTRDEVLRIQGGLKTDPAGAMADYLSMSGVTYNSGLLGTMQELEDAYAGSITLNPLLSNKFKTTYGQLVGDIKDDEAAAPADTTGASGTQAPIVTTDVKQPPKNAAVTDTGVIKFKTVADRDAAVEAGTIPLNADVQVADGPIVPFTPPSSYQPVDTSLTDTSSLEGVADASGMSVEDINASKADKARRQTQESAEAIGGVSGTVADWFDRNILGRSVGSFNDLASTITSGFAWGLDQAGLEGFADGLYTAAYDMSEGAENMRKIGFFENALNSVQSGEYTESDWIEAAAEFLVENMPDQPGMPTVKDIIEGKENGAKIKEVLASSYESITNLEGVPAIPQNVGGEDLDAALDRAPEHIEKLGSQATDAWRKLTAAVKDFSLSDVSLTTADEDNPMLKIIDSLGVVSETEEDVEEYANVFTRASDTPAYKRLQEIISDRTNVTKRKAKKVVEQVQELEIDNAMAGYVQKMDLMGATPSREDIENLKTTLELEQLIDTETQELYRGPISGKTLVEKLDDLVNPAIDFVRDKNAEAFRKAEARRGRGILERDSVNVEDSPGLSFLAAENEPSAMTRSRAPLADTRTEPDATVPSISAVNRGDRPSGLMSPNKDTRKVNVGDLATFADPELMSNIKRLHGSGSKLFKDFDNKISSGTMKPADISRLIKATRKLPNTKSKDKLLNSLFDLRDALNKR